MCHDPLCTAAWRQESPGSYAIGEHYTDTFLAFAKLSFLCKWESSEKEMEEELTLLCSIKVQKWQDEEERKQKDHSCKETTKGSILQAKSFCWRCWVQLQVKVLNRRDRNGSLQNSKQYNGKDLLEKNTFVSRKTTHTGWKRTWYFENNSTITSDANK